MKKLLVIGLAMTLAVGSLTGCASKTSTDSEVMGSVNGVDITREMLGTDLTTAEKTVIQDYVNDYLLEDFYKDIKVEDTEIEAQYAILQGQVGTDQWDSYLSYLGYADDVALRKAIKQYLQRTKMITEKYKPGVSVTDEDVKTAYTTDPNTYNTLTVNIVVCTTAEEFKKGKDAVAKKGATLESVAKATGLTAQENENMYFSAASSMFSENLDKLKVGDFLVTTEESGYMYIAQVVAIKNTFDALKEAVKTTLIETKANSAIDADLEKYYSDAKVTILGVDQSTLKDTTTGTTDTTDTTDTKITE